jgi:hypothetical protein
MGTETLHGLYKPATSENFDLVNHTNHNTDAIEELIAQIHTWIGNEANDANRHTLNALKTTIKTSLIAAINELFDAAVSDTKLGQRTVNAAQALPPTENTPSQLTVLLSQLAVQVRNITGKVGWNVAPAVSLETLNGKVDQSVKTGANVTFGTVNATKVYNAGWNDYAELYRKSDPSEVFCEGDVVVKVPYRDTYMRSSKPYDRLAVGVVSCNYGHLIGGDPDMSIEENLKLYVPVGLVGRLPVRVLGPVHEGDLLISSYDACAQSIRDNTYDINGRVIGKALQSTCDGGIVMMQIMLR